jgi:hypothetical protein
VECFLGDSKPILRKKVMQILSLLIFLGGFGAILVSVWFAPTVIEAAMRTHCNASLVEVAQLLDPLIGNTGKPVIEATVAADVEEILQNFDCPLAKGGALTVMRGNVPLFSFRDRQVMEFSTPMEKQYVYSQISSASNLLYVVTIPRSIVEQDIHKTRLIWVSVLLAVTLGGVGVCLWLGNEKTRLGAK